MEKRKLTFITLPIFQEVCKETMDYTLATSREAIICTKFFLFTVEMVQPMAI